MGLGTYPKGTGIAAAKFFLSRGALLLITDLKDGRTLALRVREVLRRWRRAHPRPPRPTFVLGKHRARDFMAADLIFQNPSVPADHPLLRRAARKGIPICNDWGIFLSIHRPSRFIGVTGTRGKSTTTTLIYKMIKRRWRRARLAGNIGVSPLHFIDSYRGEPIVAELSSWLLHHFAQIRTSPRIAVVTNIMEDHLNKYSSMHAYIRDKENIFLYQRVGDTVILNDDNPGARAMEKKAPGRVQWFSLKKKTPTWTPLGAVALKGAHNAANALAAAAAASVAGVPRRHIVATLKTFKGLPDRLEHVRAFRGVVFINDTTATTPDATLAALQTLSSADGRRNIILIAGGADKKLHYRPLIKEVRFRCRTLILLPGSATKKMAVEVENLKFEIPVIRAANM
jgi:UDP-N-acetylmuramoylalanine--D-glutamate ligase